MPAKQFRYFILTIPGPLWSPVGCLPQSILFIKGQLEIGDSGYEHWQLIVYFGVKQTLISAKKYFPRETHIEPTRSSAALSYVWKEETAVPDTRFECGVLDINPSKKEDWESVWTNAKLGEVDRIPARIRVISYRTIQSIAADYSSCNEMVRECYVFWGTTNTGKSRRAWKEAGVGAYCKDPRSKFWCGYQAQQNVVIDEFRGGIDIAHLLRWIDRYPVRLEVKGGSRPSNVRKVWITSNLAPVDWYPDLDRDTVDALVRRLNITIFP